MSVGAEIRAPLLPGISQFEVDFVVPRVGTDLPVGIDPFLLFKSRDPELRRLHGVVLSIFNSALEALRKGQLQRARYLLDFPEAPEIGFGYSKAGKRGSGLGAHLTELLIETISSSDRLLQRGVRHIEELQLFAVGINRDRVSDITANVLKKHLIEYTQRQCDLWSIPTQRQVPVEHFYDDEHWLDGNFDLPVSPIDGSAMLFVPRRIVRSLPWINYLDFLRSEFSPFHRSRRMPLKERSPETDTHTKAAVVASNRRHVERVDQYVTRKEADVLHAQPSQEYIDTEGICPQSEKLKRRFLDIAPGALQATAYQDLVLETMNFLFEPELIDGEKEVRTVDGTERRDIIFTNDSDINFWDYIRTQHSSLLIMVETKNTAAVEIAHVNQTATYLGDRLGRLGFIATRNAASEGLQRKIFSVYNDSNPRKIILVLCDTDFREMLDMKCEGKSPTKYIQRLYRKFRQTVQ